MTLDDRVEKEIVTVRRGMTIPVLMIVCIANIHPLLVVCCSSFNRLAVDLTY
jgi:hypothetical protein